MSYILDALKRADADRDRQRAAVPDLHAQSHAHAFREPEASSAPRWWLGGAAVAVLASAGVGWWIFGAPDTPAPDIATAPPPVTVAAGPTPEVRAAQPAAAVPSAAASAPPVPPPRPAAPRPLPAKPPATVAAASAPPVPPLLRYAALPPALRSQMPALSVNGSVYSRSRPSRIVILNGQVFREGDRPTDGLVVEEIRLKSSVLSFRGTRFELPH